MCPKLAGPPSTSVLVRMPLHLDHTERAFTFDEPPTWQCPSCGGGPLRFSRKNFVLRDTGSTSTARGELWFDPEMIVERFAGFAECPNDACKESVLLTGTTSNELHPDPEEWGVQVLASTLHLAFVTPAPPIIDLPERCPASVASAVGRAFELYWVDPAAAANAIRAAVEALMTHFRIPKRDKKRQPIKLHHRIDHGFRARYPTAADHLLAIKWIGNAGSHEGPPPTDDGVIDAFEVLDHALDQLFVHAPQAKRVAAITKRVNTTKRPRKARPAPRRGQRT